MESIIVGVSFRSSYTISVVGCYLDVSFQQ